MAVHPYFLQSKCLSYEEIPTARLAPTCLQGAFAPLVVANSNCVVYTSKEYFAVANFASACRRHDCFVTDFSTMSSASTISIFIFGIRSTTVYSRPL